MGFDVHCESCETSFEIRITDHLLTDDPDIRYCPNCGALLTD